MNTKFNSVQEFFNKYNNSTVEDTKVIVDAPFASINAIANFCKQEGLEYKVQESPKFGKTNIVLWTNLAPAKLKDSLEEVAGPIEKIQALECKAYQDSNGFCWDFMNQYPTFNHFLEKYIKESSLLQVLEYAKENESGKLHNLLQDIWFVLPDFINLKEEQEGSEIAQGWSNFLYFVED